MKLLYVRLSVLLHLGPKLWHFPQDLYSAGPSQFFHHLEKIYSFDTDVRQAGACLELRKTMTSDTNRQAVSPGLGNNCIMYIYIYLFMFMYCNICSAIIKNCKTLKCVPLPSQNTPWYYFTVYELPHFFGI